MPVTNPASSLTRVCALTAAVAVGGLAAPQVASAFSWRDLLGPLSPVTEPVTDVVDDTVDTVDDVVDGVTGGAEAGCPATETRQAFARFGDTADYSLAPGGDLESSAGWKLTGGARIVSGNENLGVQPGSRSLKLPIGATALSPEFCVDQDHPHFRFVSKPDNAVAGYEAVVLYKTESGALKQAQFTSSSSQSWGAGTWAPSSPSPLATRIPLLAVGNTATVQIKFVSTGNKAAVGVNLWGRLTGGSVGTVSIDSLMVDPYRRG